MKTNDKVQLGIAALVLILGILALGIMLPVGRSSGFKWGLFQAKGNEPYAMGTYEEATRIVDEILQEPGFKWLGESHGMGNAPNNDNFSAFDIEYHGVHMQLSHKDYDKYLRYLKTIDRTALKSLEVQTPPWRQ